MSEVRLIDANSLKEILKMSGSLGHIHTLQDVFDQMNIEPTINPESLCPMAQWIKVEDELPECSSTVIAWVIEKGYEVKDGHPELCDYDSSGVWFDYDGEAVRYEPDSGFIDPEETMRDVTHWMLLPENPKED